jgi:hypothetical protein
MTGSRLLRLSLSALLLPLLFGVSSAAGLSLEAVGPKFDKPTYVTSDPGNAGRLFVAERGGTIQLLENGTVSEFADLSAEVACPVSGCAGERGLMSIALDPDFAGNGRLFVDYASEIGGTIHVAELLAEPDRRTAVPGSLKPLLEIDHPDEDNHNGGQLQFGLDGYLYVSTGDGGGSNDQFHHAQDLTSPLGKILRLDPDAPAPIAPTIWSLGLRNPFRFSFDSLTGDMAIGDVGQGAREEVDFAPAPFPGITGGQGANYGWNCREGFLAGPGDDLPAGQCATRFAAGSFVEPVFDYGHDADPDLGGSRCSITGGYVVRDPALGSLYGNYVYSDFCSGVVRTLRLPATAGARAGGDCSLGLKVSKPVSFGQDAAKRLYVVEQSGQIYRFGGQPTAACPVPLPPPQGQQKPAPSGSGDAVKPQGTPTFVGIKALRRRVERNRYALLTVWVSPCEGRRGDEVELLRNGRANGTKYLSRACTARFVPRIRKGTSFTAVSREQEGFLPGRSRQLTIRLATGGRGRR